MMVVIYWAPIPCEAMLHLIESSQPYTVGTVTPIIQMQTGAVRG